MPPRVPPFQPNELLATLSRHRVDFVVIGGIAAVLHGAPYTTLDLDIVYDRSAENLARLEAALDELGAEIHDLTDRRLKPTRTHLEQPGPKLLLTRLGRLDVLGQLDEVTGWEQLLEDTIELPFGDHRIHVMRLERVIAVKEQLAREKDNAALPLLRATLARRSKDPTE